MIKVLFQTKDKPYAIIYVREYTLVVDFSWYVREAFANDLQDLKDLIVTYKEKYPSVDWFIIYDKDNVPIYTEPGHNEDGLRRTVAELTAERIHMGKTQKPTPDDERFRTY